MTDNHGFNTPEQGSIDWHLPLNENFDQLDTDLEIRDSQANLDTYTPKKGAKFFATDTESVYLGDGSNWNRLDSRGTSPAFDTIMARRQSNIVYAAHFDGPDLSTRVQNALGTLPQGRGKVIVTPRDDGANWEWGSTLSLNAFDHAGLTIECLDNVTIEYRGDEWCFDISGDPQGRERSGGNDVRSGFKLLGGDWLLDESGDIPGWMRLTDMYGAYVSPRSVHRCTNNSTDAICVYIRNVNHFSEGCRIYDTKFQDPDIGVKLEGATVTGGSGSNSFDHFDIDRLHIDHIKNTGIWVDQGRPRASTWSRVAIWQHIDDTRGMFFDAGIQGLTVVQPKFESHNGENTVGIEIGENNTFNMPLFVNPFFYGVDDPVKSATGRVPIVGGVNDGVGAQAELRLESQFDSNYFRVRRSGAFDVHSRDTEPDVSEAGLYYLDDGSNTLSGYPGFRFNDGSQYHDPHSFQPRDVRRIDSPQTGDIAYHDGSGSHTEGLAAFNGTQWMSQVDGSTIT